MSSEKFYPSYRTCDEVTARCPVAATTYGYFPDLPANAFFAAAFGILLIASLAIGIWRKTWSYATFLGIGAFGECVGYIGRILMHQNPWDSGAFEMQICCLVLSPSFIAGSIYLTMKHVVTYCGPQYSRLKPRLYPWIFVGCDFGSIILQAIGGGVAASAGNSANPELLHAGNGLIVAGISFQVATMAVCGVLVADFFLRFLKVQPGSTAQEKPDKTPYEKDAANGKKHRNFRLFCVAVVFAYLTVLIRSIYRIPEMAGGWGNPLMQRETEFLLLDGMMVLLAVFCMTAFHPGIFFAPMRKFATKKTPTIPSAESSD